MIRTEVRHVCNRGFQALAGLNAVSNIPTNIGSEFLELADEDIDVINCHSGSLVPSCQGLMMGKGRRDRIVEVGSLRGNKTIKNTGGVFTGFEMLKDKSGRTHG